MATATSRPATIWDHLVLENVSWEGYEAFLLWVGDRNDVRVNYDAGRMEIMAPQYRHDGRKTLAGTLFERLCDEMDRDYRGAGSVTLKKPIAEKGLEADECYWIRNEAALLGKDDLNFDVDPPPDLAIEIENTSTILDRLPIYAGIGVPEIWRWRQDRFEVLVLDEDGHYRLSPTSLAFPELPMDGFGRFVGLYHEDSNLVVVRRFVAWVRAGFPPLD